MDRSPLYILFDLDKLLRKLSEMYHSSGSDGLKIRLLIVAAVIIVTFVVSAGVYSGIKRSRESVSFKNARKAKGMGHMTMAFLVHDNSYTYETYVMTDANGNAMNVTNHLIITADYVYEINGERYKFKYKNGDNIPPKQLTLYWLDDPKAPFLSEDKPSNRFAFIIFLMPIIAGAAAAYFLDIFAFVENFVGGLLS